ncbi:MAG TPA: serine/threonine-protein kinase [Actinoallomurus sp.]|jgi:serine/threonine protein kinase
MEDTSSAGGAPVLPSGVLPPASGDPAEIGGYSLAGRLGAGGMGIVYLGRDRDGDLVAVKVAHASLVGDEEVHARFRAEVDCLRGVPANCTAHLLADGTDHVPPYIVTEYVAGRSLKDIVERDGPLPPEQLRALATGVARTLAAIHQARLVHRDLKPANVLLTPTGPRVIDFGIAQRVPASGGPTGTGMVVGTVGWIAPERLTHSPATPASDVFSWGCLVAYAGTARNPFGTGEPQEMARRAILESPDLGGLAPSVRPLVAAALAKAPADRPTAEHLLEHLSIIEQPDRRTETDHPALRLTRPRRRTLAAGSAVVAVAATITTWIALDSGQTVAPHITDGPTVGRTGPSPTVAVSSRGPGAEPPHVTPSRQRARPPAPAEPVTGHKPSSAKQAGPPKKPGHAKKAHGPR